MRVPRNEARSWPRRALPPPLVPLVLLPLMCCESTPTMPLARIDTVRPAVLEPGDVLVVEGEGFVEGPATLVFDGDLQPLGAGPAARARVAIEALAVSATRIELPITGTVMSRLTSEPAELAGSLEISFPTALAESAVRVEARRDDLTIELRPTGGAVAAVARRAREAEAFLQELGISLQSGGADAELVVERLRPGSPADRAGLDPRDRLLALDGAALAGLSDLSGLDPRLPHALSVMSAAGAPRELELLPDAAAAWPVDEFAALMLAAVALGLFLAFAAPARRRNWMAVAASPVANPPILALGIAALTVPMLVLPAALIGGISGPAATLGLAGLTVAGAVGVALWSTGGPLSRAGTLACGLLPLLAALGMAGAFGSSIELSEVVAGQGDAPWGWHGWANPFALMATVSAAALIWPGSGRPGAPVAARGAAWVTACGGSVALVACALGGWLLPGAAPDLASPHPPALLAGAAVFAAKCWLVLIAARWLAGAGRVERRGRLGRRAPARLWSALGLIAALGLSFAWDRAGLPAELDTAGRVLASGVFATLATALLARGLAGLLARRGRDPDDAAGVSGSRVPTSSP
jgi:hypothetical protein